MPIDDPSLDPRSALSVAITCVTSGVALDEMLGRILDSGVTALGATLGAVVLADPDQPGLTPVATRGITDRDRFQADIQDPGNPFALAVTSRSATFDREGIDGDGVAFVGAYLPLTIVSSGTEVALGSIGFAFPAPRALDERDCTLARDLAALAALAAERARLASTAVERSEWFERLAHSDPLTGLANERTVARVLELEVARAVRQDSPLSLAIFDVDDFRAANDGGHQVGDDILRRVAAVLAETVRLVDTVGRIGGDEFVLVAPGSAGALVARRVQDGIASLPAVAGRAVSISAGVATFPTDGQTPEALIEAATAALTRAKEAGPSTVAESETLAGRSVAS